MVNWSSEYSLEEKRSFFGTGLWSVRVNSELENMLVVSFVGQTSVLALGRDDVEEVELPGFTCSEQTYHTANVSFNQILQVRILMKITTVEATLSMSS